MTPEEIEKASSEAKYPRVTLDSIKRAISEVYYTDALALAQHAGTVDYRTKQRSFPPYLQAMTICMLVMHNGFIVIGKSSPASPENYNPELGRQLAHDDAVKQLWPLMGYALKERLHDAKV